MFIPQRRKQILFRFRKLLKDTRDALTHPLGNRVLRIKGPSKALHPGVPTRMNSRNCEITIECFCQA
jgi:hypothetical protein